MTAIYTADIFSTVDGFAAPQPGTWGGYWDKQGPELLDHRDALYSEEQRMVFGANTYQLFRAVRADAGLEPRGRQGRGPMGRQVEEVAGHRGVDHAGGTPGLVTRDSGEG